MLEVKRRVEDLVEFLKSSRLWRYVFEPYNTPSERKRKAGLASPFLSKEIEVKGVSGTSERKVRLSHRQQLLRRHAGYSWSTAGLRNGRSFQEQVSTVTVRLQL